MAQTYHILDTETASLSGGVVEIAWIEVDTDLNVVSEFCSRVNPERPIEPGAQVVHGISDADVSDKPTLREIAANLPDSIYMIAHNAPFDLRMVQDAIRVEATLCTLSLSRQYISKVENHKLTTLAELVGAATIGAHSALADCRMVLRLMKYLLPMTGREISTLFSRQAGNRIVHRMPFGKYKGRLTMEVPADYRKWLLGQSNVDKDIVYTFKKMEGIL